MSNAREYVIHVNIEEIIMYIIALHVKKTISFNQIFNLPQIVLKNAKFITIIINMGFMIVFMNINALMIFLY